MPRTTLSMLALALLVSAPIACGGSQKHAEVPDFTEKGWSDPAPELTQGKGDPSIQSGVASNDAPAGGAAAAPPPESAPAAAAPARPEASPSAAAPSDAASAPFPPPPKATKPAKKKKGAKPRKG